jgi:hypothetical protein
MQNAGVLQPHSLSAGRLIFLIVLVVFFTVLFISAYLVMRRPNFGQEEKGSNRGSTNTGSQATR